METFDEHHSPTMRIVPCRSTAHPHRLASLILALAIATTAAHAQSPAQLRATADLRIDGAAHSLVPFPGLLVGPNGRIVVPQSQDGRLLFFAADGRKLGAFGRKGAGPGEFGYLDPRAMGFRGDTLWVFDFNNGRRLSFVSSELRYVRSQTVATPAPYSGSAPRDPKRVALANAHIDYAYADGTYLLRSAFGPPDPERGGPTDYRFVVVNPSGVILRELLRLPDDRTRITVQNERGAFAGGASVPFAPSTPYSKSADGSRIGFVATQAVSGNTGSYSVTVVRATGDTAFSRSYSYTPVRIPAAAKDSVLAAMVARGRVATSEGRYPGQELANKARPLIPNTYSPVLDLILGDDETAWLLMRDLTAKVRYRALDARGSIIGEVVLPARSMLARATRSTVWVIEYDEDGVPSVVRYRVGH
jgi:hypothetical protein